MAIAGTHHRIRREFSVMSLTLFSVVRVFLFDKKANFPLYLKGYDA